MRYTLHTAEAADWAKADKKSLNIWQKIAYRSYGIVTPANIASLGGGLLAVYGLFLMLNGETLNGLVFLAIGRVADVADGVIAESTKTKSPLGEMIDATIDKIVVVSTLIVVGALELIPWIIIAVVGLQNVANVIISLVAKLRDKTLHPSRLGKISAAFSWMTIILYPLGEWLQREPSSYEGGRFLILVSLISFGVYVVIGLRASLGYLGKS